jgi:hypothetical protein
MDGGYVTRSKNLRAAVSECERINRPVICWPEDIGHITPDDLPLIDLQIAEKEFIVIESHWRYGDEPLTLPTPGRAYAVVEEIGDHNGTKMNVVTFRPKTADECKCDEDREIELLKLANMEEGLIVELGFLIEAIANQFIHPDITWEEYPEINRLLDECEASNKRVFEQWAKVENGHERDAGHTE